MDVISRVLKGKPKLADTLHVPPKVVLTVLPLLGSIRRMVCHLGFPAMR
jgi:hypothetical protein